MSDMNRGQMRRETDSMVAIEVAADRYWEAKTKRARMNMPIGVDRFRFPRPIIRASCFLNRCAAMHIAAVEQLEAVLIPAVTRLRNTLHAKAEQYRNVVKIGRTHLQDATPITLGQEIGGWVAQLDAALAGVRWTIPGLCELAIG